MSGELSSSLYRSCKTAGCPGGAPGLMAHKLMCWNKFSKKTSVVSHWECSGRWTLKPLAVSWPHCRNSCWALWFRELLWCWAQSDRASLHFHWQELFVWTPSVFTSPVELALILAKTYQHLLSLCSLEEQMHRSHIMPCGHGHTATIFSSIKFGLHWFCVNLPVQLPIVTGLSLWLSSTGIRASWTHILCELADHLCSAGQSKLSTK